MRIHDIRNCKIGATTLEFGRNAKILTDLRNFDYLCGKEITMEDFGMVQGITSIFGFLAVCVVMMWKIVSDKKENDKSKENAEKIAKILEYVTTEREESKRRQDEMQKQIADNTSAIEKITEILDGISKKMSKFAPKNKK